MKMYLMQKQTAVTNATNKNKYCVKAPHSVISMTGTSCFKRGLLSVIMSLEWRYRNMTVHIASIQYILINIVRSIAPTEKPQKTHNVRARYFDFSIFRESLYKKICVAMKQAKFMIYPNTGENVSGKNEHIVCSTA